MEKQRVVLLEFIYPKRTHHRIIDLLHHPRSVASIGEHPLHAEKTDVVAMQQSRDGGVEDVFQARSPKVRPNALKCAHNTGCDQMPFIVERLSKQIEADRMPQIGRIEIGHVFDTSAWNVIKDFSSQIAVRVNDADTVARLDVLENQVAKQRCLTSAGFSNGVEVMSPIFGKKNKGHFLPPLLMNSQDDVLHISSEPLLRGDNSPNTPPALEGGG